jgi:hypothetical protein
VDLDEKFMNPHCIHDRCINYVDRADVLFFEGEDCVLSEVTIYEHTVEIGKSM